MKIFDKGGVKLERLPTTWGDVWFVCVVWILVAAVYEGFLHSDALWGALVFHVLRGNWFSFEWVEGEK